MTQSFKVGLAGFEPMRIHQSDPTLTLSTRPQPPYIERFVAQCLSCAQHKDNTHSPGPILEYPTPDGPWDTISIDLLELPRSHQGSSYVLVCVDHFNRFVVLAPLRD